MKILFLSDLLAYGGASKLIYDLLPRMKVQGNECELLILTDNDSKYVEDLRKQNVPVNVVPKEVKGHLAKINYIKNWIKNGNYDVIHANLFPTIYYCSIAKWLLGRKCPPLVMTEHSTDNKRRHKPYLRPLEKVIYKKYDHVISISYKVQENICKWLGTEGDKRFSVVENGIDVDAFRFAESISKIDIFPKYMEGDTLLLVVGSFTPQKNHKKMIEALALLPENYKLILAGEGPLYDEIRQKIILEGVDERVVFLGFRKDVARIMHSVDILVIPSIWEGFGLIAAEGMACGLPIVASNVPGLSEVVGDVGEKFSPQDSKDIAEKIVGISHMVYNSQFKERAQSRVKRYDINRTVVQYLVTYEELF